MLNLVFLLIYISYQKTRKYFMVQCNIRTIIPLGLHFFYNILRNLKSNGQDFNPLDLRVCKILQKNAELINFAMLLLFNLPLYCSAVQAVSCQFVLLFWPQPLQNRNIINQLVDQTEGKCLKNQEDTPVWTMMIRQDSVNHTHTSYFKKNIQMVKSSSHIKQLGPTHPGRPTHEEPHVKKTMNGKTEKVELICKIDQVRCRWCPSLTQAFQDAMGYVEDEFDDLKELFKVSAAIT